MKPVGVVRKVDQLGRVVLPKSLRKSYDLDIGAPVEILVEGDRILLERHRPKCVLCFSAEHVVEFKGKYICNTCLSEANVGFRRNNR